MIYRWVLEEQNLSYANNNNAWSTELIKLLLVCSEFPLNFNLLITTSC